MDTRYPYVTWTVKEVRAVLVDAAWHSIITGGRAMPGIAQMSMWGDSDPTPDDSEKAKRLRRRPSPARVSFLERAIEWPSIYLHDNPDEARMLQLWIFCKTSKRVFRDEVERRGIARATAYRQQERALTLISVGLDRDGVPLWGEE